MSIHENLQKIKKYKDIWYVSHVFFSTSEGEYKNLSWLWDADRKIHLNGQCSVSWGLSSQ